MIEARTRSPALAACLARKATLLARAAIARRRVERQPAARHDPATLWPLWRR